MRKYYEEPDFKAVIFESSDVIMVSEEDWVENDENSWEESNRRLENKNEKREMIYALLAVSALCCDGNWMQ